MIVKKCFKFRLRPNRKKANLCAQFAGAARWVYNRGLSKRKEAWGQNKSSISCYEQNKELTLLKKCEDTSWLSDIHSQVLQQALADLELSYQAFFRRCKAGEVPGFPRYRVRGEHDSFRYPQGLRVENDQVFLPKIGWIRFRKSREISGVIKQGTVIREGQHWYICLSCEVIVSDPKPTETPSVIGIDLGLENFAIMASKEGIEEVENPRFFRKNLNHLRFLSKKLSRKKIGSSARKKIKQKLQRFHLVIKNKRKDMLHKLSTRIVKSHDLIVVENLKVKGLLQQAPKALARSISDAGWRQFLEYLKYKCDHYGKQFKEAGKWFPSTKQCFRCKKNNEIALSERIYSCDCGFNIHRDHNSALNLRAVGTTGIKACGAAL